MKTKVSSDFLSEENFYDGQNSLTVLLEYCYDQVYGSDKMAVFLTKTERYFLIEIRISSYDGSFQEDRLFRSNQDGINPHLLQHPLVKLASEACGTGHFAEIQSTTGDDAYGMNLNIDDQNRVEIEYFDQKIMVDEKQTLYMISVDSNISQVWNTIRSFTSDKSNINYYITSDNTTKKID